MKTWTLLGRLLILLILSLPAAGQDTGPRVVVLGTAQDGGMPQTGCEHTLCAAARKDPKLARHVASLAVHVPSNGHTFLVDATPDLPAQIGHYLGLAHFGFESLNTKDLPVHCSPRMTEYLRGNGPWSQLVRLGNIKLEVFQPGEWFSLGDGLSVKPFAVPHRDVCGTFLPDHAPRAEA
jgi:pyrroloquinoline quinone biosynthesis protein B